MRDIKEIEADLHKAYQGGGNIDRLQSELLCSIINIVPLSELETICTAWKDGRCKVLPCKEGDTIYRIVRNPIWQSDRLGAWKAGLPEKVIEPGIFQIGEIYNFGETVFLDYDAAVAALGKDGAE